MPEGRRERKADTPRFGASPTPEREVYLLLQHLAGTQIQELAVLLRPHGITPEQFHVLRVLGDAGAAGLACSGIAERSVSGDPDVTRLLDRLEQRGWVARARDADDRRVVTARITAEGRRLLARLEAPVAALHAGQFDRLASRDLAALRRLVDALTRGRDP